MHARNMLRNVLFIFLSAALLLVVLVNLAIGAINGFDTMPNASVLEGRTYQVLPEKKLVKKVMSGKFQKTFEKFVADHIPCRDTVLLGNASLQRATITTANIVFGFEAYPTFFNSDQVYIPAHDSLAYMPLVGKEKYAASFETLGKAVAGFAHEHPDKRIIFYLVEGKETPPINPAYELMSDAVLPDDVTDVLEKELAGIDNVFFCSHSYDTYDQYYEDFFKTDHHWNIKGAIAGYNVVANALGLNGFTAAGLQDVDGFEMYGSSARLGLDLIGEKPFISTDDFSYLKIYNKDGIVGTYNHDGFNNASQEMKAFNFYDYYYALPLGGDGYLNEKSNTTRNAVVVMNSYGGAILPMIASQYDKTRVCRHLYGGSSERTEKTKISKLMKIDSKTEADDIFLIAHPLDYATAIDSCPNMFS